MTVGTFETRRRETSPKVTTILGFATTTPPIPVTVDAVETQSQETSPKVTTVLRFATTTPPIPVTNVLRFATTTPPIPVTVDTFGTLGVKSDDSSAFRDDLRLPRMRDTLRHSRTLLQTLASACGRLRMLAAAWRT